MATSKLDIAAAAEGRALRSVISKVADWQGKTLTYQRVPGGVTNVNWKVHVLEDKRNYFLKMPGAGTELFINRAAAREGSSKAGQAGIAPKLVHYIVADDVEIQEYLEGFRSCTASDMFDARVRLNVVRTYRAIHAEPRFSHTRDGFQQIEQHLASVFRLGARLPPDLDYLLWQAGRAEAAVMASGHDLSPCFNDGYISNYMVNATGDVRIIDWEYASNNDPVWDLAIFCMECFFNAATRNEIVEEYYGTLRHDVLARIDAYEALVCLKWGLWAALQAVVSRIPFDFCKYADLLFMRARGVMRHPRFEAALLKL